MLVGETKSPTKGKSLTNAIPRPRINNYKEILQKSSCPPKEDLEIKDADDGCLYDMCNHILAECFASKPETYRERIEKQQSNSNLLHER